MRHALLFVFSLMACSPAFADQAACDKILKKAEQDEVTLSPVSSYKVTGSGRLHFHTAPTADCVNKDVFVVPGDRLIAYSEYKGWFSVMYMNFKTGKERSGWVESKRLKLAGTMAPKQ